MAYTRKALVSTNLKNLSVNGAVKFNELKRLLPSISSMMLSERLLELEREGLVSKNQLRNSSKSRI